MQRRSSGGRSERASRYLWRVRVREGGRGMGRNAHPVPRVRDAAFRDVGHSVFGTNKSNTIDAYNVHDNSTHAHIIITTIITIVTIVTTATTAITLTVIIAIVPEAATALCLLPAPVETAAPGRKERCAAPAVPGEACNRAAGLARDRDCAHAHAHHADPVRPCAIRMSRKTDVTRCWCRPSVCSASRRTSHFPGGRFGKAKATWPLPWTPRML